MFCRDHPMRSENGSSAPCRPFLGRAHNGFRLSAMVPIGPLFFLFKLSDLRVDFIPYTGVVILLPVVPRPLSAPFLLLTCIAAIAAVTLVSSAQWRPV